MSDGGPEQPAGPRAGGDGFGVSPTGGGDGSASPPTGRDGEARRPPPFRRLPGDDTPPPRTAWLTADDGIRLRAAYWAGADPARGTVLLFTGRTEYIEKYAAVARRLTSRGLGVLTLDWRGQGASQRLLPDPRAGHVEDFADYQRDMVELVVLGERLDLPRPWHLLAHSMGGAIGLAAVADGLPVASAAFSAPMWGINAPLPPQVVQRLAGTAQRLGRGTGLAPGTNLAPTYVLHAGFATNTLTGDPLEWARLVAEAGCWPDLTLGGATYRWLGAALSECRRLAALPSPGLPTLIGLGTQEKVVSQRAIRDRAARWPSAELMVLDDARHELMFERRPIADRFLGAAVELFLRSG